MSRIAQAYGRAGRRLTGDDSQQWESESETAARYLSGEGAELKVQHKPPIVDVGSISLEREPQIPSPRSRVAEQAAAKHETIDFELTAAIRRIFLSPESSVRSLLFCAVPGDSISDVAWRTAELLASQSGKRIAFVQDGAMSDAHTRGDSRITRVGWYDNTAGAPATRVEKETKPVLGKTVGDLYASFAFAIFTATASTAEDLLPLAQAVDAAVVVVAAQETRIDAAAALTKIFRAAGVNLLGSIFIDDADHLDPRSLFHSR